MTKIRIRYRKQDDKLISTSFYPTSMGAVNVVLLPNTLEYSISNVETNEIVASGNAKNMHELKKKAKVSLKEIGMVFVNELRMRSDKQDALLKELEL